MKICKIKQGYTAIDEVTCTGKRLYRRYLKSGKQSKARYVRGKCKESGRQIYIPESQAAPSCNRNRKPSRRSRNAITQRNTQCNTRNITTRRSSLCYQQSPCQSSSINISSHGQKIIMDGNGISITHF